MEDIWLEYAKRLQALASTGASYTKDQYDRERYDEIAQISIHMMAQLGNIPVSRIQELVSPYAAGYVTPKVDVRGVVIRKEQILLVKEKHEEKWALPGGFADVGLSPAENISKEIWEEAGLKVDVTALIGIRHKSKTTSDPDVRDFYKLFFECRSNGNAINTSDPGIVDVGYFRKSNLPDLSTGRTTEADIGMAFDFCKNDTKTAASFH